MSESQDPASNLHPALISAAWRWGRVGGTEAAATIVHLIELGALSACATKADNGAPGERSFELRLVPGRTTAHRSTHAPFVLQGRVEGLHKIDRLLLSILFDRIAHSPSLSMQALRRFANEHPWQYWLYLKEWRSTVRDEAKRQQLRRRDFRPLVRQVRASTHQAKYRTLATTFGLAPLIVRSSSHLDGPAREATLFRAEAGVAPVIQLQRLLGRRYPFGYSPPSRIGYTPVPSRAKGLIVRADEE